MLEDVPAIITGSSRLNVLEGVQRLTSIWLSCFNSYKTFFFLFPHLLNIHRSLFVPAGTEDFTRRDCAASKKYKTEYQVFRSIELILIKYDFQYWWWGHLPDTFHTAPPDGSKALLIDWREKKKCKQLSSSTLTWFRDWMEITRKILLSAFNEIEIKDYN